MVTKLCCRFWYSSKGNRCFK